MTNQGLFDAAAHQARQRAYFLALANDPARGLRTGWTRRQCLKAARNAERRVVDLSVKAEQRCLREVRG